MAAPMAPQSVVNWPWKNGTEKSVKCILMNLNDNTVLRAVVVQLNVVLLTNRNHSDFRDFHVVCLPEILFF